MTRHRFDPLSFVTGLLTVALAAAALGDVLRFDRLQGDWVWPVLLIAAGLALLLTLGGRDGDQELPPTRTAPARAGARPEEPDRDAVGDEADPA